MSTKAKPQPVDGWWHLTHPDIDAPAHRVPDEPGVLDYWAARGWEPVEAPEDIPAVPDNTQAPPGDEDGWVELEHPDTKARHRFPADESALALAQESGWQVPSDAEDDPEGDPGPKAKSKSTKKAAAPAADSTEE